MRILGICHDVLICSAALIVDGEVVVAIPEERLDRVKQSRGFPMLAADACLKEAGLTWDELDEVAVAWNPGIELESPFPGYIGGRRWRGEHFYEVPAQIMRLADRRASRVLQHRDVWEGGPKITYLNHYLAHIGNALCLSPFESCAIAVVDGRGEKQTALLGRARGSEIELIEQVNFPHSLGLFYGTVTEYLGFKADSDEWKVMALASYARASNQYLAAMRALIELQENGTFRLNLGNFEFYNFWSQRMFSDAFVATFGPPRAKGSPIEKHHCEIAAAMQQVFEEVMVHLLCSLHQRTGEDAVVVSGGCFMNSVFNGKIEELTPFRRSFIGSSPDDSGTGVGAALYLDMIRNKRRASLGMQHSFWGLSFTDEECLETAKRFKLPNIEVVDDPSDRAAEDLEQGSLIGWMQGRAEFGQRALGNRSILADPRRGDAKDLVNAAVKFREAFRPFAPAVLAERVDEYFECEPGTEVAFMERVLRFRPGKGEEVPAVMHVDGSGRAQTVDSTSSPRYHALIRSFERRTGVPIVLNTSFNLNGEPIVNNPEDAIRTFYSCGLDTLYMGNVRIAK